MDASFELWCCYEYLCEAYDRLLGGDSVLLMSTPAHASSQRNSRDRRAELRSMTADHGRNPIARHLSFEEVAHIAVRSRFLRHFGPVGRERETLWGRTDELGRVAYKRKFQSTNPCGEITLPGYYETSFVWNPADPSRRL